MPVVVALEFSTTVQTGQAALVVVAMEVKPHCCRPQGAPIRAVAAVVVVLRLERATSRVVMAGRV
jgi:hypothetical protein